ncbi:Hemolysin, chromosomal [Shimia thalassica]|uniref:Hemolysin, chromosomal n=1 Tax=Shimia thalassica TaxID=1715693 RepID=A0A0P1ID21_9RHOB|nr:calcium-binding protein [Shimia thalassica]CUK05994.1 Hemolysin, chromosomal [Shimia thalassica]
MVTGFNGFSTPIDVAHGNAEVWGIDQVVLADGRAAVVWTEDGNAATWLRFFDSNGVPQGAAVRVTGESNRGSVTQLADGSLIVAYLDLDESYGDILARRYSPNGTLLGQEQIVFNDASATISISPELTALPDGSYLAVFTVWGLDADRYGVFAQRMSATGNALGDLIQVNQTEESFQSGGSATRLNDGGFAITWKSRDVDGSFYAVMVRLYDQNGTPTSSEMQVNQYSRNSQTDPSIAALEGGGFAIAWQSEAQDGSDYGIYARVYSEAGVALGSEFLVNQHIWNDQADASIAARPDGGFTIAWQDEISSSQSEFRLRDFDSEGSPLADEYAGPVTDADFHVGPEIGIGPDGAAYLVGLTRDNGADTLGVVVSTAGLLAVGDATDNTLQGSGGADRIEGHGGHDTIHAGDGADTVLGGAGDDRIWGGQTEADRRDLIYAGVGDDLVNAGYGNDEVRGDAGNDILNGQVGADTLIGGLGDDTLTGASLGDVLFGGSGQDFLNGGFGFDRLNGGADADRFFHLGVFDHGSDWVQDFSNEDRLVFGQTATFDQFQVNTAQTLGAGDSDIDEAFVVFRPSGQVLWALVDGAALDSVTLQIAGLGEAELLL